MAAKVQDRFISCVIGLHGDIWSVLKAPVMSQGVEGSYIDDAFGGSFLGQQNS